MASTKSIDQLTAITTGGESDTLVIQTSSGTRKITKSNLLKGKADGINYDDENGKLQILSGEIVLDEIEFTGGGGGGIAIGDVSGATATTTAKSVFLTWSDPTDVELDGVTLATWGGTRVVRKAGSAPTDKNDGTVVIDSKTRNAYSSTPFEDTNLEYGTTYYYRFFPYTTGKLVTDGSSVSATPSRIVIANVPSQDSTAIPEYDGTVKTATFINYDSTKMTVSGNTGTNAGSYTATFTPKEGYCWSDTTTTGKTVSWTISKKSLTVPSQSGTLTYNGSQKTASWDSNFNSNLMSVTGNTGTNAGSYTATFMLSDTDNYKWSGSDSATATKTWTIGKATGSFTISDNSATLNTSNTYKDITVTITGDGTIASPTSSDSTVATGTKQSSTVVRINNVNQKTGTATITITITDGTNYTYSGQSKTVSVTAQFVTIYGAEWDGTSTTAWSRTDASANFTDPVPAVNGGSGSSPFDNCSPWKDMTIVDNSNAGKVVKIPKFYYKWTRTGSKMKLQIADGYVDGFYVSPAHADRGDGKGERDFVYVGRYHCGASNYKSVSGVKPEANHTRAEFRSSIHNLGSTIWQWDYATLITIQMLYLVEFADWNSQAKIGYGCGNNSGTENMGSTDSMQYHTGTMAANRTTYTVGIQYRYIEGLWSNVYDWCDGIYFSGADIYCIKNPSNFSDTANGTKVGTRATSSNYISAYTNPTASGFEYAIYPNAVSGSDSTYVCDYCGYNASGVVLYVGGNYNQSQFRGLFFLLGYYAATSKNASIGSRLLVLP